MSLEKGEPTLPACFVWAPVLDAAYDSVEHRKIQVRLPALPRCYTTDNLGAVGNGLLGMKRTLRPGETLRDDARVFIDENGHVTQPPSRLW